MVRTKGLFDISANFEPLIGEPLDARLRVPSMADLTAEDTFGIFAYKGMLVSVYEDDEIGNNGLYLLMNFPTTDASNWSHVEDTGHTSLTWDNIQNKPLVYPPDTHGSDAHSESYEPANENIQEHISDDDIHVTTEDKSNWSGKQDTLIAGDNITIEDNVISSIGGGVEYTAGDNITIEDNVISATDTTYESSDFDIKDLTDSTDLRSDWSGKQDVLTAGDNVSIEENVISATDTTYESSDFDIKDLTDSNDLRSDWSGKQDALVSTTNIKSINGESILGEGNIDTPNTTYTSSDFDIKDLTDSTDLRSDWSGKQDELTAGTNVQISEENVISATDTTYTSSDFDIKDLTDSTSLRSTWSGKQDALGFTPEDTANKGQNNGYCGLDAGGKVAIENLPSTLLIYKGVWNAETNTPTLSATDVDKKGFVYNVSVAGTQFGISFSLGDWAIYNDSGDIEKSDNSDDVVSVNGQQGVVVLGADDISDTETTNKWTNSTEKSTWNGKQDALVSTTNIKSINGESILGEGNINTPDTTYTASDFDIKDLTDITSLRLSWSGKQDALTAGTNINIVGTTISATDTTYTASDFDIKDLTDSTLLRTTWSGKQDALVSTTNIKSINGESILGEGNITTPNTTYTSSDFDIKDLTDSTLLRTTWSGKQDTLSAGTNINIVGTTISATDTTYTASDFDIKDLTDITSLRSTWSGKQDALGFTPQDASKRVTTWTATPLDTNYPSEKLVKDAIDAISGGGGGGTYSTRIPIEFAEDGSTAPTDAEIYVNGNKKVRIRQFSGISNNYVTFDWSAPYDMDTTKAIQFRVKGIISDETEPSSEGVAFVMSGYGIADDGASDGTFGTEVTITKTGMSHAEGDVWITDWSGDVTIKNITNDTMNQIKLYRNIAHASDTYGQYIGVTEIEIKYTKR